MGCDNPWAATPRAGAGTLLSPRKQCGLLMCKGTIQGIRGISAKGINKPGTCPAMINARSSILLIHNSQQPPVGSVTVAGSIHLWQRSALKLQIQTRTTHLCARAERGLPPAAVVQRQKPFPSGEGVPGSNKAHVDGRSSAQSSSDTSSHCTWSVGTQGPADLVLLSA